MSSLSRRAPRVFIAVWIAILLANLAFWGAVVYVVLHFVAKAW